MSNVCPHCRAALEPGDQFCGDCGGSTVPAVADPPAPKSRHLSGRRIAGAVGLIAVLGSAAAWYGGYLPDSIPSWADVRSRIGTLQRGGEAPGPEGTGETSEPGTSGGAPARATEGQESGVPAGTPSQAVEEQETVDDPSAEVQISELPSDEFPPTEELEPPIPEDEGAVMTLPGEEIDAALPILFVINTEPEGARLFVDGEYRGTTPTLVDFDSLGVFQVRFELAGHDDVVMRFDPRDWGVGEGGAEEVVAITIPIGGSGTSIPETPIRLPSRSLRQEP